MPGERHKHPDVVQGSAPAADSNRFALVLVGSYAVLLAILLLRHEPWRDELHFWMGARDSGNLLELWHNRRYDGHPPLWSFLLFWVSRLTRDPMIMQALHWCISVAGAAFFVWASPFSRVQKTALLYGYFSIFEYAAISRNYGLGMCWLWLLCYFAGQRPARYYRLGIVLILMALTNVQAFVLGCSLTLCLGLELGSSADLRSRARPADVSLTVGLAVIALALFLVVTRLPEDNVLYPASDWRWNLAKACRVVASLWQAYVPLPMLQVQFHDTNILHGSDLRLVALAGVLLFVTAHLCLTRGFTRAAHLLGSGLLVVFAYGKMVGFTRHIGHHYLLWLACLWLDNGVPAARWRGSLRTAFVAAILVAQVLAGVLAVAFDLAFPFSTAARVPALLQSRGLQGVPVAALADLISAPVAAWMDRPIYYPQRRTWGTFVPNISLEELPPPSDLVEQLHEISASSGGRVVFIWDRPLGLALRPGLSIQQVGYVGPGIIGSERYFVYLFTFSSDFSKTNRLLRPS